MARIRTIKPEFWTSEQVMECSPLARLLFIGIWNFCDDGGNHPDAEKTLKALIFPGDDIDSSSVRRLLDELSECGLLTFYEFAGKRYLHVNGWRHQKIDRPTFKHPIFVETTDESGPEEHVVDEHSTSDQRGLTPGREGEGKGKGKSIEPPLPPEGEAAAAAGEQDKPQRKRKEPAQAFDPLAAKPTNVSAETWARWVQHRKEIRKPLTPTSCGQQAAQLATCQNPDAVIAKSIASGWQGLFPDKEVRGQAAKPSSFTNLPKHNADPNSEEPDHDGPNF